MVNTLASNGARSAAASPSPITAHPQALAWIKRRARRLQSFFVLSRHDAVRAAVLDWADFNPASAL